MQCQWQSLINILPIWMRDTVDKQVKDTLLELRMRINAPPQLITHAGMLTINRIVRNDDIQFCLNLATKYSPWTASTIAKGFITTLGGHRIGLCGTVLYSDGKIIGANNFTSICIRVARDFPGLAEKVAALEGSILIIGKPGSGKTTLLRDLIRQKSNQNHGAITVVDERQEIFPVVHHTFCFITGDRTDVLSGCNKVTGIEMAIRCMGPSMIAVDEITAEEDCQALLHAGWCGVTLYATAHAGSKDELYNRPVYQPILKNNLFENLLIMNSDKTWHVERIK